MLASLWHDWFGINGSVTTNLVATVIGVTVGYFAGLRKAIKSHQALHEKLDKVHKHLGI